MMSPKQFPYKASVSVVNLATGTEFIPVFRLCAEAFGVSKQDVLGKCRKTDIAIARHASNHFYYLLIKSTKKMEKIGFVKSHASIIHSNRVIENIVTTHNNYRLRFEQLEMSIIRAAKLYSHRRTLATHNRRKNATKQEITTNYQGT